MRNKTIKLIKTELKNSSNELKNTDLYKMYDEKQRTFLTLDYFFTLKNNSELSAILKLCKELNK